VDGGRVLQVSNVLWCTGFRPGFSWIELPIHGEHEPDHRRGIVSSEPGLYFVGLEFLYAATSETVTGVTRDARRVVRHLTTRRAASNGSVPAAARVAG
jgi:putative flavoprotein involved in K+ transport